MGGIGGRSEKMRGNESARFELINLKSFPYDIDLDLIFHLLTNMALPSLGPWIWTLYLLFYCVGLFRQLCYRTSSSSQMQYNLSTTMM